MTEDSRAKREREMEMRSKKKEKRKKSVQKKKVIDAPCESNIKTVVEEEHILSLDVHCL